MNKSILNLFCLILCVTISLVKGKTLISGLILESDDPIPPLVKSCHDKITDKLLSCDEEAKEDWHLTYPWDVRSKAYCCTTWQKFDCIYSNAQ
ncbi:unnamed protein product [Oppiella nova]|uniref:Uncharacterized protein n=1 Tax=Oppiella nova TaxID=334625 RepID=A0A7R9MNK9_9ACAR|nr:unnamed protein product [Oppiella nova]CAG2180786.1 unnamed protein product [Oppiella nova]